MVFWLASIGLLVVTLGVVMLPLLRGRSGPPEGAHDVAVYKHQITEIDHDRESGLISEAEASGARAEIARRLLAADERPAVEAGRSSVGTRSLWLGASALLAAGLSYGLYLGLGAPQAADQPLAPRLAELKSGAPSLPVLVGRVEEHLAENPEDGRGWEVLAPIYFRLGRYEEAARAFGNANRILGITASRLADEGEALVSANRGIVSRQARIAFEAALKKDPTAIKSRFFLAISLSQDGRLKDSLAAWTTLLKGARGDEGWVKVARQKIAGLEAKLGLPSSLSKLGKPTGPTDETAGRGPSADDVAAAGQMSAQDRKKMIEGMVAGLAERLDGEGGSIDEWLKLIRAYGVLGNRNAALAAVGKANKAFENNAESLAKIKDLAGKIGLSP